MVQLPFSLVRGFTKREQGAGEMCGSHHLGSALCPVVGSIDCPTVMERLEPRAKPLELTIAQWWYPLAHVEQIALLLQQVEFGATFERAGKSSTTVYAGAKANLSAENGCFYLEPFWLGIKLVGQPSQQQGCAWAHDR